jgi:predicted TIM-barrel fold metal-dependent hydrolase
MQISFSILFSIAIILTTQSCLIDSIAGSSSRMPEEMESGLSKEASAFLDKVYEGIVPEQLVDYHTHIVGINEEKTGAYVNKNMLKWWHIKDYIRFLVYKSSLKIDSLDNADEEVIQRLALLIRSNRRHGKHYILAFDKHYNKDGTVNESKTEFYVPNEYIYNLSQKNPDIFLPAISIHPYRKDALDELDKWGKKGVKLLKWLPNAQGMNPSDPDLEPFYKKMVQYKISLLTHAGEEKAVDAEEDQKLGNPLLLRFPLDLGVKVIVAHCASLGTNEDLDNKDRNQVDNYELFLRLMDTKKYEGLLFGETSAQAQFNRLSKPIEAIIKRQDLHKRLVNGSDYPLPAVNIVIRTGKLVSLGLITDDERKYLNEIYEFNPLVFDFAVKRAIRLKENNLKLSDSVFMKNPGLK